MKRLLVNSASKGVNIYDGLYGIKVYLDEQFIGWYNRRYDMDRLYICPSLSITSKARGAKRFTRLGDAVGVVKRNFTNKTHGIAYIIFTPDESLIYVRDGNEEGPFVRTRYAGCPIISGELSYVACEFDDDVPDDNLDNFVIGQVGER